MCSESNLKGWNDAKSFDDLCILMQKSLTEDFDSFTSLTYKNTVCALADESLKDRDDFIKLNKLGFLTIDSQPGSIVVTNLDNNRRIARNITDYIERKGHNIKNYVEIYEQREYIEGFLNINVASIILSSLCNYIVCIQPLNHIIDKVIISREYNYKIEPNTVYIFLPKNFEVIWPDLSDVSRLFDLKSQDYYLINLTKKTFNLESDVNIMYDEYLVDIPTNLLLQKNSVSYDTDYYMKDFKPELRKWMIANTYLINIINPEYRTNGLNKLLVSVISNINKLGK